ncbi:MAG: hypothetical protein NUV56_00835, partial [Candidatus Uhrbacteria bacterium]|nr:hypothetical protein [Candidatus Uhrbacteria bacterium]
MASNQDPRAEKRVSDFEKAKSHFSDEATRIGVDIAAAVNIKKGKKLKKRSEADVPSLDALGEQIAVLEQEVARYGDAMGPYRDMVSDLRRSYDETYERVTGAEAPKVVVGAKEAVKKDETEPDLSVMGISLEFGGELRKKLGVYGEAVGAIRKGWTLRADALKNLEEMKLEYEELEARWDAWKGSIADMSALSDAEQRAMKDVDDQFFTIKTRHERALAEAEKIVDPEPKKGEQRGGGREGGRDEFEEERSWAAKDLKRSLQGIERLLNEADADRAKITPVQLRNRVDIIRRDFDYNSREVLAAVDHFFGTDALNAEWKALDDFGAALSTRLKALETSLPPESDEERANRIADNIISDRNIWAGGSGRERRDLIER